LSGAKGRQFRLLRPHGRQVGIHASNRRVKPDGLTDLQPFQQRGRLSLEGHGHGWPGDGRDWAMLDGDGPGLGVGRKSTSSPPRGWCCRAWVILSRRASRS